MQNPNTGYNDGRKEVDLLTLRSPMDTASTNPPSELPQLQTDQMGQPQQVENDITRNACGSVTYLVAETPAGLAWLRENLCTEPWQWNGSGIAIEARMVADIIEGAVNDGLEVAA